MEVKRRMRIAELVAPRNTTVPPIDLGPLLRAWTAAGWFVTRADNLHDTDSGMIMSTWWATSHNPDDA